MFFTRLYQSWLATILQLSTLTCTPPLFHQTRSVTSLVSLVMLIFVSYNLDKISDAMSLSTSRTLASALHPRLNTLQTENMTTTRSYRQLKRVSTDWTIVLSSRRRLRSAFRGRDCGRSRRVGRGRGTRQEWNSQAWCSNARRTRNNVSKPSLCLVVSTWRRVLADIAVVATSYHFSRALRKRLLESDEGD